MEKKVLKERVEKLCQAAAAKGNILEPTEVLDQLGDLKVTPEELEQVYSALEYKGVRVETPEDGPEDVLLEDDDFDENYAGDEQEEGSMEDPDRLNRILEGVGVGDPIREYLKMCIRDRPSPRYGLIRCCPTL